MAEHAILSLVAKTMEKYAIPILDLWMSKFRYDMFVFVTDFINSLWVPCYVIVDFLKPLIHLEL
jgi:hypothetical protein